MPADYDALDASDLDVSSAGPTYIAGANLVVSCSKDFICFVMSTSHMGQLQGTTGTDPQSLSFNLSSPRTPTLITGAYSSLVAVDEWESIRDDGGRAGAAVRSFWFHLHYNAAAATTIVTGTDSGANGTLGYNGIAFPGAKISGSYDSTLGNNSSDIIWATTATGDVGGVNGNAFKNRETGTFRAFRATDLTELYKSNTAANSRDTLGTYAKFSAPTVANGRVFVPTWDNTVAVYGLLSGKVVLAHP